MGNDKKIRKGPNRIAALITYIIAFAALALGLFLPFSGSGTGIGAMRALQLPAALYGLVKIPFLESIATQYPFESICEIAIGSFTLQLDAILYLVYAIVFVGALVALIPIIANVASKKARRNTALRAASFIECLAFLVLSVLLLLDLNATSAIAEYANWALISAFGGVTLMLIVQSFIYKKGSGLVKFLLFLVSTVTLLIAVYYDKIIQPLIGDKIPTFGIFSMGLYGDVTGLALTNKVFAGFEISALSIVGVIATYLVLVNFVLDGMGLGKRTNRGMLIANVIRFALQVVAGAVVIILSVINKEVDIGMLSIIISALGLVELIVNIIRLVAYKSPKERAEKRRAKEMAEAEKAENGEGAEVKETKKQRKQREKEERKAQKEAEKAKREQVVADEQKGETAVAETPALFTEDEKGNIVYNPIIYNGPKDDFIRSLTNEQQLEFSRLFLERQVGALPFIPDYVVGNKNDKFFSSLFIYYGRVRDLISDGLMNEIYKQCKLMK